MSKKYMKLLIISFVFMCIPLVKVNADCDVTEQNRLASLAANVKISYEYEEEYIDEVGVLSAGVFRINISGLTEELYVVEESLNFRFSYENNVDGIVTIDGFPGGDKQLSIYGKSSTCNNLIKRVTLAIPRFNYYALDERCANVDSSEFALCDRWYQYNITEETFNARYNEYMKSLNKKEEPKEEEPQKEETWMDKTINFIKDNIVFVIAGIILVISLIVYLIIRKKRNELV